MIYLFNEISVFVTLFITLFTTKPQNITWLKF